MDQKIYTQAETLVAIRAMGLSARYSAETGEYRINLKNGGEATAYYTPDADDAIGTAKAMKAH